VKNMVHLFVDIYDSVNDEIPSWILDEQQGNNQDYFKNLNDLYAADKGARVVIRNGAEYQVGDHIRLLDEVRRSNTDTVSIDPKVAVDVDLNKLDFADKAAAIYFIINPNPRGEFRLRVLLYDTVDQEFPNLILYDWEFQPSYGFVDLNLFNFADKTARVIVEKGPNYKDGDRILLWDSTNKDRGRSQDIDPRYGPVDLNRLNFADKAEAVEFILH
jgi:hypothetical protein